MTCQLCAEPLAQSTLSPKACVCVCVCVSRFAGSWPAAGVIGRRMKMENFVPAIPEIVKTLGGSTGDAHRAAVAITTTGELPAGSPSWPR